MTTPTAALRPRASTTARVVRPEIQALRAVAVLGVVLYHLWPLSLTGGFVGVDVFFVVSGFLITNHLLRELLTRGSVSLPRFWARRARRLLPASLLVLLVTALGVWLWVPDARWAQFGGEIIASAVYVENWALAAQSVDYMALSNVKSPVQHFWSLGVEEQFYVAWPLLLAISYVAARRWKRTPLTTITLILTIVTASSFVFSVLLTHATPTVAYFSTFTRAWELGAGALLAIASRRAGVLLPARFAAATSWLGFAALAATMVTFDAATPFPSFTAALPVVATLVIIASGAPALRLAPTRLLALRPVQFIGDVSYGTYLWHWPLIILVPYAVGDALPTTGLIALLGVSIALGWLSKTFVEDPIRTRSWLAGSKSGWSLAATAVGMIMVVGAALPLASHKIAPPAAPADATDGPCYGALAMAQPDCGPPEEVALTAPLSSFSLDLPPADVLECELATPAGDFRRCDFSDAESSGPRVALVGDSHATRWVEPLREVLAEENGGLSTFLVSGCASITRQTTGSAWGFDPAYAEQCRSTSERMLETVAADPDIETVVLTNRTRLYVTDNVDFHPLTVDMVSESIDFLQTAGKRVVILKDPPEMNAVPPQGGGSAADCLTKADAPSECSIPRAAAQFADPLALAAQQQGVGVVSVDDLMCDAERCMSRIGGIVVYSDDNHLTRSFAMSLVTPLRERFALSR